MNQRKLKLQHERRFHRRIRAHRSIKRWTVSNCTATESQIGVGAIAEFSKMTFLPVIRPEELFEVKPMPMPRLIRNPEEMFADLKV